MFLHILSTVYNLINASEFPLGLWLEFKMYFYGCEHLTTWLCNGGLTGGSDRLKEINQPLLMFGFSVSPVLNIRLKHTMLWGLFSFSSWMFSHTDALWLNDHRFLDFCFLGLQMGSRKHCMLFVCYCYTRVWVWKATFAVCIVWKKHK